VPGVDEAHINGAFGAGFLHAKREGVAKAELFGDWEGGHVTQLGVPIQFGAGAGQHARQVLHVFHGAHQVAKVGAVGFITADVDDIHVGEFVGDGFGGIHEAERGGEDDVKAFAR